MKTQLGAHMILRAIIASQRRSIVHAIYRQASRFIPDEELRRGFFTD